MKKKKALFVFNPHSGKGMIKRKLADILDIMVKAGYEVTAHPTQARGEAIRLVEEEAGEYELVVCSGGDGTLDETVTGMMRRPIEERVPIGYIPTGSTNDFGSSLKIPKDQLKATEIAVNGKAFATDIGYFNGDSFVYVAAFGAFTDVSYETTQEMKNALGHVAYLLQATQKIGSLPSYELEAEVNGEIISGKFIFGMITNSRSIGGFSDIAGKNVELDDGLFEVTLIKTPNNILELNEILASLTNLIDNTDLIYTCKTDRIVIRPQEEIAWTLDGEFGGNHKDTDIRCMNKAVEIMIKKNKKELEEAKKQETSLFGADSLFGSLFSD